VVLGCELECYRLRTHRGWLSGERGLDGLRPVRGGQHRWRFPHSPSRRSRSGSTNRVGGCR